MAPWALWRWMLASVGRHPALGLSTLGFGLLAPLLAALAPWGRGADAAAAAAWLYPAGLVGAWIALAALTPQNDFLERVAPATRLGPEWAALGLAILLPQLGFLVGLALTGVGLRDAATVPGWLAMNLHLAALAWLTLGIRLPLPGRVAAFPAILWVLPPLLADGGRALRRLAPAIDPSHHLAVTGAFDRSALAATAALAPVAGIVLAGWLLRTWAEPRNRPR